MNELKEKIDAMTTYKRMCFMFYISVIQNTDITIIHHIIFFSIELCQIISFGFERNFHKYWNNEYIMVKFQNFFGFFCVFKFFQVGFYWFVFGFSLCCGVIIIYTFSSYLSGYFLTDVLLTKRFSGLVSTTISFYHFYINVLFLPLLRCLFSVFNCVNGKNAYVNFSCTSATFYILASLSGIFSIILIFYCFFSIFLCYDMFYEENANGQQTSAPEGFLFFTKIFLVVMIELIKSEETYSIIYTILSLCLFLFYYRYANYYSLIRYKTNICFSILLVFHSLGLLFSVYIETLNSGFMLFFTGVFLSIIIFIFLSRRLKTFSQHRLNDSPVEGYICIGELVQIVKEAIKKKRKAQVILRSYICYFEKNCVIENCPLKKAEAYVSNNIYNQKLKALMYQHVHHRYKLLLKHSDSNFIKLVYSKFLYSDFNKPNLAKKLIYDVSTRDLNLQEEFLLFRLKSITDESLKYLSFQSEKLTYMILFKKLKENILKISSLYKNFWNSLLILRQNNDEVEIKLDNCGEKIKFLRQQVNENYQDLLRLKPNDLKVMMIYAEFLRDVMDEEEESLMLKKKIEETKEEEEINYLEGNKYLDIHQIPQTDKVHYIIVSGTHYDLGNIVEVSLTFCIYSGYLKDDIVGKNYKILLPDFMWKPHDSMLKEKLNEVDLEVYNKNYNKRSFKSVSSFFISKSRYIKQANFNPVLMINELDMKHFVLRVTIESLEHKGKLVEPCYVLTDSKFIIQNYTINCNKLLAMNNIEEVQKENLCIKDFIRHGDDDKITWVKKSPQCSRKAEFYWNSKPIKIKNKLIGFFITLIPKAKNEDKFHCEVEESFVPPSQGGNSLFVYNQKDNMFLRGTDEERTRSEFLESLKHQALQKIEYNSKKTQSNSGETSDSSSYSGSSYTESSIQKEVIDDQSDEIDNNLDRENDFAIKIPERPSQRDPEVYRVKVSNIKFFIYNFEKRGIQEVHFDGSFLSQVDEKMNSVSSARVFGVKESHRQKQLSFRNSADSKKNLSEVPKEQKSIDDKIMKQIQYSISKTDVSSSLMKLSLAGLFTFTVLLCEGIVTFILFKNVDDKMAKISLQVEHSYRMLMNCITGSFYIRELTLLGNKDYTVTFQDTDEYFIEMLDLVKKKSARIQELSDLLISATVTYSEKNEKALNNIKVKMFSITDGFKVKEISIALNAALSQATSALYFVTSLPRYSVTPMLGVVYFAITNSLNGMMSGVLSQISIISEEYLNISKENLNVFLFILIAFFCFSIFSFFLLSSCHFSVERKKEAYLAIFEEISIITIAQWLEKCTNFHQKYTFMVKDDSKAPAKDEANSVNEEEGQEIEIIKESIESMNKNPEKVSSSKRKKKYNQGHFAKKLVILCTTVFSSVLCLIIYLISRNVFIVLNVEMDLYTKSTSTYLKYLGLFNAFREYMFNENSLVNFVNTRKYFEDELKTVYEESKQLRLVFEKSHSKMSKDFLKFHDDLYFKELCTYSKEYFTNLEKKDEAKACPKIGYNSSQYGLSVLLPQYIEEIKTLKSEYDSTMAEAKRRGFRYNLSLYGTSEYMKLNESLKKEDQKLYFEMHPIHIFNCDRQDRIMLTFQYLLLPIIENLVGKLELTMDKTRFDFQELINVIIYVYISIVVLFYTFVWRRIESNVTGTVVKAKNMLMIIPKNILLGLESVYYLFNIHIEEEDETEEEGS